LKIVDLNILLYAVDQGALHHEIAKVHLEEVLSSRESVGFPWVVLLGFLRVSTNRKIFPNALTTEQAVGVIEGWLSLPIVHVLEPGPGHWTLLKGLLKNDEVTGDLVTDAHLAALALEYEAELLSTDSDFAKFDQLKWTNPLNG
jgi:toxin-antitoxin system PIN domain toxin